MERHGTVTTALFALMVTLVTISEVSSKRVILMPAPLTSHTKYHTNIARALHDIGHEVWVCMPAFLIDKNVLDTTGFKVLPYTDSDVDLEELTLMPMPNRFWRNETENVMEMAPIMLEHIHTIISDKGFVESVRQVNASLIVIDSIPTVYMFTVVAYKLGIPFAVAGSHYDPITMRVPFSPAAGVLPVFPFTSRMTFFQRVVNSFALGVVFFREMASYHDLVSLHAPERPYMDMAELIPLAEIVLVENDHILDYPQPTLPNVIRIGGTAITPAKPLKEPFRSFVENATQGVILVSFGSYVVNLPEYVSSKMLNAFSRLPFKVVWRVNMSSPDPDNLMTSVWMPQNDLIAHKNVKLFVSHCGKNGQYEALYNAKPLFCMPLFGDQWYAAERTRSKGWSLTADIRTLTEDEIVENIMELVSNSSYAANIALSSEIFKEVQGLPVKKAAYWLDHVMKYGGAYMRYAGQVMPGYQYYCLDLLILFGTIWCLILVLFYVLASRTYRYAQCKFIEFKKKIN